MVAVDETLKPIKIPTLELRTPEEKRRFEEATIRKEINKKLQQEHRKNKEVLRNKFSENDK